MDLQSVIAEIEPLAKGPIHLPPEHANERVFPAIAATMAACSVIFVLCLPLANRVFADIEDKKEATATKRQLCYQITNMCTNACLGVLGLYFEYTRLPKNPTMAEKIQGQEDFYIFSSIQIGYQLWSVIMGTVFIQETVQMLFHHVSVICVGSMSGFLNNGFRYWTPYFFGIFEISSVPLGLMNTFKENKAWMEAYPKAYGNIRIVFAASFLTIRIFMLIPRLVYLRDVFLVPYLMDPEHWGYRIFLFMVWLSSSFLFMLQIYWGHLIVMGIVKHVRPKKEKDEKPKDQ